jgi:hypothetical protein
MKIISSFDSFPIENNRWGVGNRFNDTVYLTAFSLLSASQFYDVTFYTDEKMAKVLADLPIDIKVFPKKFNYSKDFWVEAKFYVFSKQTEPFIHIDTDVILYRDVFKDTEKYLVICERPEVEQFKKHYKKQVDFFTKEVVDDSIIWDKRLNYSMNCGTIGFNDLSLSQKFIENYYKLKNKFNDVRDKFSNLAAEHYEPCIVLEQYNLTSILNKTKVKPLYLLGTGNLEAQSNYAEKIGYTHLYGGIKYQENVIKQIHSRFKEFFPFYYHNIKIALNNR